MLAGREFLGLPGHEVTLEDGTVTNTRPIESDDMAAHLTYFRVSAGTCTYHDENFDPEAQLPPEEGEPGEGEGVENPEPGSDDWPTTGIPTEPGGDGPTDPGTTLPPDGQSPDEPQGDPGGDPVVTEPDEPSLPEEAQLP